MNNTTQKARKRAPGKHWCKGLTLVELIRKFPDDKTAEAWIASIRWPEGPRCPHCDHDNMLMRTATSGPRHREPLYVGVVQGPVELTDEPGQRSNLSPEIVNVGL